LQCGAVWCSVVQCGAVCCSVLQCAVVCCSVLQCVAVCCSVACVCVCVCIYMCVFVSEWYTSVVVGSRALIRVVYRILYARWVRTSRVRLEYVNESWDTCE